MIVDEVIARWWEERVNQRSVWRTDELPDPTFKRRLIAEALAFEIRTDVLILCSPGAAEDPLALALFRFWEIVGAVMAPYAPYVIQGPTAMRLHLDDRSVPRFTYVATARSRSRIALLPEAELVIDREVDLVSTPAAITTMDLGGVPRPVEAPESALVRIRPRHLREERDLVLAFLKAAPFDLDRLKRLSQADARPAKFRRLADWCEVLGRGDVAAVLRVGRSRPRTLTPLPAPTQLLAPARRGEAPYVTRFIDQLRSLQGTLDDRLDARVVAGLELAEVLRIAATKKTLDTYHSSTIEGYRVTPEEIDVLMGRADTPVDGPVEEIERRMALRGYLDAHTLTVAAIERMFGKERALTEGLVQDVRAALFQPSIDADLTIPADLRGYRRQLVSLRGSRYVPPRWDKVDALMQRAVEVINDVDDVAARAVLIHYALVTIHPYDDGNGRTARLLMNFVLGAAGAPWVTIRSEDREIYFRALEQAQCDAGFGPLIDLHSRYFSGS